LRGDWEERNAGVRRIVEDFEGPMARGLPGVLFTGYPLVGGTRERHFGGINFKPRKLPACTLPQAQVKTRRLPPRAPAHFAGVRVHYPGALPRRCVGQPQTLDATACQ